MMRPSVPRLLRIAACTLAVLPWAIVTRMSGTALATAAGPQRVRVMSFNIALGGESRGQSLAQTAAVIRAAGADVVGIQETMAPAAARGAQGEDNGQRLAGLLGWNYVKQPHGRGILTRLEVVERLPTETGARLRTDGGTALLVFNVHLAPAPYQPYALCDIGSPGTEPIRSEAEAIAAARATRGGEIDGLLADVARYRRAGEAVFVTGDFNEPSHQDWTAAAAAAGRCPLAVAFPSTRALSDAGFVDAFRAAHPDPIAAPGRTWTTTTHPSDRNERHDRIDFVFAAVPRAAIEGAATVGESAEHADVVVAPWPSDHRAVVATIRLP